MSFLDIVGQIFFRDIFTSVLSFQLIRKTQASLISKIALGVFMTLLLASVFFVIALDIAFGNSLERLVCVDLLKQ